MFEEVLEIYFEEVRQFESFKQNYNKFEILGDAMTNFPSTYQAL